MEKENIVIKANQMLEKIKNNKKLYTIFGLSTCGYCKKTLSYMKDNNLEFKYYDMDKYYEIFVPILNKLTNLEPSLKINPEHRTFPVIFFNEKFIGGYSDLINTN